MDQVKKDAEGHPLDPNDSLSRPPPNRNWEFELDETQSIPLILENDRELGELIAFATYEIIRVQLHFRDRLKRLQMSFQKTAPDDESARTLLKMKIDYKLSLVKSTERVLSTIASLTNYVLTHTTP